MTDTYHTCPHSHDAINHSTAPRSIAPREPAGINCQLHGERSLVVSTCDLELAATILLLGPSAQREAYVALYRCYETR